MYINNKGGTVMYKTKLGLSNCMVAGIIFLLALFVEFNSLTMYMWPFILLVAYVLTKEEDLWLKASAVKAVMIILAFSLIPFAFSFVWDIIEFINFFLGIAEEMPVTDGFGIMGTVQMLCEIVEKIYLFLLAIFAFKGKTVKVPVIDGIIRKHIS